LFKKVLVCQLLSIFVPLFEKTIRNYLFNSRRGSLPDNFYDTMADLIKIKKGLDLKLEGEASPILMNAKPAELFAVKPTDYHGVMPKLVAKVGTKVKAGDTLFYDKAHPEVIFPSPVSGEVIEVSRGERRKLLAIVVKADEQIQYASFDKVDVAKADADQIKAAMLAGGLWPYIKQRPYDIIASKDDTPRDIFISAFDSSPLAPNNQFILTGQEEALQAGVDALAKLTTGQVHVSINGNTASKTIRKIKNINIHEFVGPHPAGNVGVQIHHIAPINKDEKVWTVNIQDLIIIGRFFLEGKYDASRIIALCGSEVNKPAHYKVISGTAITPLVEGQVSTDKELRYISGSVLTGEKISEKGYLGAYDNQITVIPESGEADFMGWGMPAFDKFSAHNTVGSKLIGRMHKIWKMDARMNGEERAIVMSNEYDKVFPMDILPEYLLKAIITKDIDKMEQLGIYEVAPEDFALCEVVCTSKIDVQNQVRKGLDYMIQELG